MKLAFVALVVAGFAFVAGALLVPSAQAQITSISGPDQLPALVRGTCFSTADDRARHVRVEEVRNAWIRVSIAADRNQTTTLVRIESRWMNGAWFREVVILSGPKACDFPNDDPR